MKSVLRMSLLATATVAALGFTTISVHASGRPDLALQGLVNGKAHVADQLIVEFKAGASDQDKSRALGLVGGKKEKALVNGKHRIDDKVGDVDLIQVSGTNGLANAMARLKADPSVEFAEPNWIVQHAVTSNDTYYSNGSLWGMYGNTSTPANQYGSQAGEAWAGAAGGNCSTVVIGIIDEGYMYTHTDLAANAFKNPGDSTVDGIDNDNNGKVDDVYGWDFDGNNNTVFDGVSDDHGTHVAGTIGGVGGNGRGVAGVCWSVKLLSAKFLGGTGGTTANAIAAVDYFTDLKIRHNLNLVATNNSWGGGGFSQGLFDAIERANSAGILFIAAAGNSGADNDVTPSYPSGYSNSNIIAVAALASNGSLASYSQYGAGSVDIAAPGSGIFSTVPVRSKGQTIGSYASYNGTSMATPHVTGAAAMYAARRPGSTAAQIKAGILNSAVPTASVTGKVVTNGRLDVSGY